jgi:predicted heme/steroid binding protein
MNNRIVVNGYTFDYSEEYSWYSCRGEVCYDDDHDEMPEPRLMEAAYKLEEMLKKDGYNAEANHSEKGWVEVTIFDN